MTGTIIILGVIVVALLGVLVWVIEQHQGEREEWVLERQRLVDRAIARHAGEVIAFDRDGKPRPEREEVSPVFIEGLS